MSLSLGLQCDEQILSVIFRVLRALNSECLLHIMSVAQSNNTHTWDHGGFSLVNLDHANCPFCFSVESFCPLCVSLPNIQWLIKVRHIVQARVMQLFHFLFLNSCLFSFWLNFCPVSGTGLSPSHSSHCVWGAPNFHVALKDFDLDVLLVLPALNVLW